METVIGIVGVNVFHKVEVKFNNGLTRFKKIVTINSDDIDLVEVVIAPESDTKSYYFVDQFDKKFAAKMQEVFGVTDISNLLIEFSQEGETE